MAKVDNPGIWEKIQKNVQETERLMGQKKYNQSMIKARQTLEYMVKLKCDQAGIVESSLDHMIHELYDGQWISKSTAEHYLQILSIGYLAARVGDISAYNANLAYDVLSQEIYSFTDADKAAPRPRRSQTQSRQAGSRKKQPSGRSRRAFLRRGWIFRSVLPAAHSQPGIVCGWVLFGPVPPVRAEP